METIELRRGLSQEDIAVLLQWANAGGADFLRQFAGPKWRYPLTQAQIAAEREDIWSIFCGGTFAGILQKLARRGREVRIGRFLLDPDRAGRGIGAKALTRFCGMLFADDAIDAVSLNVYRFNARALRCYEKCGFEVTGTYEDGTAWAGYAMVLRRDALRAGPDEARCGGGESWHRI